MKKMYFLLTVAFCLFATVARAQGGDVGSGCDASPENPTVILAALGSLGAAGAVVRQRVAARRAKRK